MFPFRHLRPKRNEDMMTPFKPEKPTWFVVQGMGATINQMLSLLIFPLGWICGKNGQHKFRVVDEPVLW